MHVKVTRRFGIAINGGQDGNRNYYAGDVIDSSADDLSAAHAKFALDHGYGAKVTAKELEESLGGKAKGSAPENKAHDAAPKNKSKAK